MASARSSSNTLVLCTLALSLLASAVHAAVAVGRIPGSGIFYNPRKAKLFYYPRTVFALAQCGPRDDETNFSVKLDRKQKAYVVTYIYAPFDTDNKGRFQNLRSIKLNLKTGVLSFNKYGATTTVDLKTYLRTDGVQPRSGDLFGQDWYAYDATVNQLSDKLVDLDGLVTEALKLLAKTARFFGRTTVPYPCREKQTTVGHPSLKNLANYLTTLSRLPPSK